MLRDFLSLNYWKTKNKLAKIRELINRIGAKDLDVIFEDLDSINNRLDRLNEPIINLGGFINNARRPPNDAETPEEEEEVVLLPDLIVSEITSEEKTNYIDFSIVVKNIGTAPTIVLCKLEVAIPSQSGNLTLLSVPPLSINGSITLKHQYAFDPSSLDPKETKTILATADATNIINESNEGNNTKSITFQTLPEYDITGVIIHLHNEEGFEIGSLSLGTLDRSSLLAYLEPVGGGAPIGLLIPNDEISHSFVNTGISPGDYILHVNFNGLSEITKQITVTTDNVTSVFITFERELLPFGYSHTENGEVNSLGDKNDWNVTIDGTPWPMYFRSDFGSPTTAHGIINYMISKSDSNASFDISLYNKTTFIEFGGICRVMTPNSTFFSNTVKTIDHIFPSKAGIIAWYSQSSQTGKHPNVSIRKISNGNFISILQQRVDENPSPFLKTLRIGNTSLYDGYRINYPVFPSSINSNTIAQLPIEDTVELSGEISNWTISTVPYNTEGTGI